MTDPRYPIGKLATKGPLSSAARAAAIAQIAALPAALHDAVRGLSPERLDTPYRDGGWSVRQVVHHLADSHVNAYVRHKLVASSARPVLQGYDENAWAAMPDANGPIGGSLLLVQSLHDRWTQFLRTLPASAFTRVGRHTENGPVTLDDLVATYAWHGRHHVAQITTLRHNRAF
ncbi:MAG: putative metal-dependent hydrolase [Planctomycetota bacterium]